MNSQKSKIEVGARSETGYVRNENQDRMSRTEVPLGQLYVVADGMGGHKGGAIAAELTVKGLVELIGVEPASAPVEKVIREAFKKVNQTVYQKAHSNDPATEKMGSTAVLLLISGNVARLAHVGDSRAYRYRNRQLRQLTTDHTIVQKMVEAGMLKPEEAASHPDASVLERAIGSKSSVEVDISDELSIQSGDAFLLCSDGLSGYVTDAEIETLLRSPTAVQQVTEELIELALEKGGEDNITVQLVQYGPRKEAQLIRKTKPQPIPQLGGPGSKHRPFHSAAALFMVAALSAGVSFFYQKVELDDTKAQLQSAKKNAQRQANIAEKWLEQNTTFKKQIENYRSTVKQKQALAAKSEKNVKTITTTLSGTKNELKRVREEKDKLLADLANKVEELTTAKAEIKKVRSNAEAYEKNLETAKKLSANVRLIFLSEPNAAKGLIKDDFIEFAREVDSLEIRWTTNKEFEDLQINVPNGVRQETKIYFTEEIDVNQNAKKLLGDMTKIKAALYRPEERDLKSAIEARFGKRHILVVIGADASND